MDFEDFYEPYPRHVGRKQGEKAWAKLTDSAQNAAIEDVKKRNRLKAWSANPRLIPHPSTYLNQERWNDDWEAELKQERAVEGGRPDTGPVQFTPTETLKLPPLHVVACRLALRYMRVSRGNCDPAKMIKIRDFLIREIGAELMVDIRSDDKQARGEAFWTFGRLLVERWDEAMGLRIKHKIIKLEG